MIKIDEADPIGEVDPSFPYRDVTIRRNTDMKQFYDLQKEIGRGKFGTVYRCTEKSSGLKLAAKFISIAKRQDRRNAEREVEIMRELQHPRLIQMYDAFEMNNILCVVLELIEGGELFERVIDDDFILTEKSVSVFMRQICEGIAFIHSKNILHLDMKPENILCLTRTGNRIKIIDFGLARKYDPEKKLQVLFGTPEFVAPEVVNFDSIGFGTDMWSVGVICYVLLSGLSPFMGETDVQTMANVTIAQYDFDDEAFNEISTDAKDFIGKLLLKDREQRMSATECLSHRWLQRRKQVSSVIPSSNPIPQNSELDLQRDTLRNLVDRWNNDTNISLVLNNDGKGDKIVDICKMNGISEEQSKLENGIMNEINSIDENDERLSLQIEEAKNIDAQRSSPVPKKQAKLENILIPIQSIDTPIILNKISNRLINGVDMLDDSESSDTKNEDDKIQNNRKQDKKASKSPTPQRSGATSPNLRVEPSLGNNWTPACGLEQEVKTSKSPTPQRSGASSPDVHEPPMFGINLSPSSTKNQDLNNSQRHIKSTKSPTPQRSGASSPNVREQSIFGNSLSPSTTHEELSDLKSDKKASKSPTPQRSGASSPNVLEQPIFINHLSPSSTQGEELDNLAESMKASNSPTPQRSGATSPIFPQTPIFGKNLSPSATKNNDLNNPESRTESTRSPTPQRSGASSPDVSQQSGNGPSPSMKNKKPRDLKSDKKASKSPTPQRSGASSPNVLEQPIFINNLSPSASQAEELHNSEHSTKTSKSPTPQRSGASSPTVPRLPIFGIYLSPINTTNELGNLGTKTSKSFTSQRSGASSPNALERPTSEKSLNPSTNRNEMRGSSEDNREASKSSIPSSFASRSASSLDVNEKPLCNDKTKTPNNSSESIGKTSKSTTPTPLSSTESSPSVRVEPIFGKHLNSSTNSIQVQKNNAQTAKNATKSPMVSPATSSTNILNIPERPTVGNNSSPNGKNEELNCPERDRKTSKSPTPQSSRASTPAECEKPIFSYSLSHSGEGEQGKQISRSPTPQNSGTSTPREQEQPVSYNNLSLNDNETQNSSKQGRKISKSPTPQSSGASSPKERKQPNFGNNLSPIDKNKVRSSSKRDRKTSESPTPQSSGANSPGERELPIFGDNLRPTDKIVAQNTSERDRETSKSPTPQNTENKSPVHRTQPTFSKNSNSGNSSTRTSSYSITVKKEETHSTNQSPTREPNVIKANSCDIKKENYKFDSSSQTSSPNTTFSVPQQCSTAQENKSIFNSGDNSNDIPNRDKPSRCPIVEISDESYEYVKKRRFVIKSVQSKETHETIKTTKQENSSSCSTSKTPPSRRSPFSPERATQSRIQGKSDFISTSDLMKRRISDISNFFTKTEQNIDHSFSDEMSSFCNRLNKIVRLRHDSYSMDSDGLRMKRPKFRISHLSRDVPLSSTPPLHADLLNYLPMCDETIATPRWSFQKNNPFHSDPSSLRNSPERLAQPSLTKKILSKFFNDSLEYDLSTPSTSNGLPKDKISGIIS